MKKEYDFSKARRVTPAETEMYRKAIEATTGKKRPRRPGRPTKAAGEKLAPVSIRLHPRVIAWAKKQAEKRGVGYQTIISQVLWERAVA